MRRGGAATRKMNRALKPTVRAPGCNSLIEAIWSYLDVLFFKDEELRDYYSDLF